jgi:BirA family biotin operon repressor/biotin-[acetyl-CoA-carboxylase] ligase
MRLLCIVINTVATKISRLESVDSTQEELLRRIRNQKAVHGEVITAAHQTSGLGAGGNTWQSNPGENLLLSIALKFRKKKASSPMMSMCLALSVLEVIRKFQPDALIKWPNDILINRKKVAGILVNNTYNGSALHWTVWGIGINVNQTEFPPTSLPPTSLSLEGSSIKPEDLEDEVLTQLSNAWWIISSGNSDRVLERYNNNIFGKDEVRTFIAGDHEFEGMVVGVNKNGALVLQTKAGQKEYFHKELKWKI